MMQLIAKWFEKELVGLLSHFKHRLIQTKLKSKSSLCFFAFFADVLGSIGPSFSYNTIHARARVCVYVELKETNDLTGLG